MGILVYLYSDNLVSPEEEFSDEVIIESVLHNRQNEDDSVEIEVIETPKKISYETASTIFKSAIEFLEQQPDDFPAGKNDICRLCQLLRDIELKRVESLQQGVLERFFNTNTNSTPAEFP
jgi:hypothetical protein